MRRARFSWRVIFGLGVCEREDEEMVSWEMRGL